MTDDPIFPGPSAAEKSALKPATPEELEAAGFRGVAYSLREGLIRKATLLPSGEVGIVPLPAVEHVTLSK